ncbi:sedoheptulose 7-phosphate cyclase [Acinetobacter pittii]|uniref:sedoheptulose 7-phosphate cyclase n=1 Tax=Acinetobacter pittii TaxID=48296 RepID=UPI000D34082C|nr:sedoheptulose 7-phosphate cyclase [Acinetobacter pittii]PTV47363.1 hypothetical protein DBL01_16560 [Acinetobacter pittii]
MNNLAQAKNLTFSRHVCSTEKLEYSVIETEKVLNSSLIFYPSTLDSSERRLFIIDKNVSDIYQDILKNFLNNNKIEHHIHVIEINEGLKQWETIENLIDVFIKFNITRRSEPVIALGGGILTDIVGLACSLYRRGIPYIRIPTTLMGMIDAAIGIKTGVNFKKNKNRIGSYYPAQAIIIDREFLKTLDLRQIKNGIAEIIKLAIVKDPILFDLVDNNHSMLIETSFEKNKISDEVFSRSIHGMIDELEDNLKEENLERIVDFGHSFSPFIEMNSPCSIYHGEAVAIDICISTIIAEKRNLISKEKSKKIINLIQKIGLPIFNISCDRGDFPISTLTDCIKHRNGFQRIPLPISIGEVKFFNDIKEVEVEAACNILKNYK